MDFVAVPAIVIICYLFAELYKSFMLEPTYKHIPVLCGVLGGILGVLCFLFISGYIPADNVIVATAIGVVSGFASTGANQVWKQNK